MRKLSVLIAGIEEKMVGNSSKYKRKTPIKQKHPLVNNFPFFCCTIIAISSIEFLVHKL